MAWRPRAAIVTAVLWVGLATQAYCAGLADLPQDQQQTAKCMLSVVSSVRGVTEARLRVVADPASGIQAFIDYAYRHRSPAVSPQVGRQEIDITRILATKIGSFDLGGITSPSAPDLDDNDFGMFRITDGWRKMCGLTLSVLTD